MFGLNAIGLNIEAVQCQPADFPLVWEGVSASGRARQVDGA